MSDETQTGINHLLPPTPAVKVVGSGRPYTQLASKGESKLLINLEIHPALVNKKMVVAVILRGLETPPTMSEAAAVFAAWGWRDLGDQGGTRTYKRIYPMVSLPCNPKDIMAAWNDLKMKDVITTSITDLLAKDGATMTGAGALDMMLDELIQPVVEVPEPTQCDGKVIVVKED